jgi:predicted transcriptional regulator of viral defense system
LRIDQALCDWFLEEYPFAAICKQKLHQQFYVFFIEKEYKNQKIEKINARSNAYRLFQKCCSSLESHPDVEGFREHPTKGASYFVNNKKSPNTQEVICAVYPYGYFSYLSAMRIYGLTKREMSDHYFTALSRESWKAAAVRDFQKLNISPLLKENLSSHERADLIPTYPVEGKYSEESLIVFSTKKAVEYEWNGFVRVQNVIDLFIDMTRRPQYCGGFEHVLSVYNSYVDRYFDALIARVDTVGSDMDKSRVGFILNKMLLMTHPKFEVWKNELVDKRGGSRKLISHLAFDEIFDPDWNISLNNELAKNPPTVRHVHLGRVNLPSIGVLKIKA